MVDVNWSVELHQFDDGVVGEGGNGGIERQSGLDYSKCALVPYFKYLTAYYVSTGLLVTDWALCAPCLNPPEKIVRQMF